MIELSPGMRVIIRNEEWKVVKTVINGFEQKHCTVWISRN